MIYGVTGYVGSGKDTVVDFLVKHGYKHASLSDEIRYELKANNISETRGNLISMGNSLRKKFGNTILAQRALAHVKDKNNIILSSIRNPDEIKYLHSNPDFKLIFVEAPQKIRFDRIVLRHRVGDCVVFKDFVAKEKQEESDNKNSQQMHKIKDFADIIIVNNDSLENLYKQINEKILL